MSTRRPAPEPRAVPLTSHKGNLLRRASRSLLTTTLSITLLLTLVGPALAAPPDLGAFGPAIDPYARYEGQSGCSSTEQPGVADFRSILQRHYGANGGGILRSCSVGGRSEHKEGRAYDWMLDAGNAADRQKADEFLGWLLATDEHGNRHAMARRFGVMYIIWNGQTWSAYRPDAGWTRYTGANPHTDHIHFSFSWAGARRETSYWTGGAGRATGRGGIDGPFTDVSSSHQFATEISWLVDEGITVGRGNGRFAPNGTVTRAQMAAFLWRLMGEPAESQPHGFTDVADRDYFAPAVRWLAASGITEGAAGGDRFEPNRPVSRGQMAAFLHRLAGAPSAGGGHGFGDLTGHHYEDAVVWLVEHGITLGLTDREFGGQQRVLRGQTAAFLYRLTGSAGAWAGADAIPAATRF